MFVEKSRFWWASRLISKMSAVLQLWSEGNVGNKSPNPGVKKPPKKISPPKITPPKITPPKPQNDVVDPLALCQLLLDKNSLQFFGYTDRKRRRDRIISFKELRKATVRKFSFNVLKILRVYWGFNILILATVLVYDSHLIIERILVGTVSKFWVILFEDFVQGILVGQRVFGILTRGRYRREKCTETCTWCGF